METSMRTSVHVSSRGSLSVQQVNEEKDKDLSPNHASQCTTFLNLWKKDD